MNAPYKLLTKWYLSSNMAISSELSFTQDPITRIKLMSVNAVTDIPYNFVPMTLKTKRKQNRTTPGFIVTVIAVLKF